MSCFDTRQELRDHQLSSLRHLLAELLPANAFYGPRINECGMSDGIASLDEFVERMPFTTKQQMIDDQHRNPPFGTNLTYPLTRYTRFNQTSATSGVPMRWLDTTESWQWMLGNWQRVYAAAGVTQEDRVYFAFSFGPFLGFWTAFDAATQVGCLCIPGGGFRSAARLHAMRDNQATILCCTPTYAMRLAEVARHEGVDIGQLAVRRIIVAGEPGGSIPSVREAIHRQWPGADVFDHHGMTEVGPVSYQCPGKPGSLVVIESAYYAEIVDPKTLRQVPKGELGELVLTTLGRIGSPLIRYRTGDLVRQDLEMSDAGRELALAGGILGRADDMVVVRGVNVYPSAVADLCAAFPNVAEHRVTIRRHGTLAEMLLEIEPVEAVGDDHQFAQEVAAAFKARLHLNVPVTVHAPGTLPRFEMKSRRWVVETE